MEAIALVAAAAVAVGLVVEVLAVVVHTARPAPAVATAAALVMIAVGGAKRAENIKVCSCPPHHSTTRTHTHGEGENSPHAQPITNNPSQATLCDLRGYFVTKVAPMRVINFFPCNSEASDRTTQGHLCNGVPCNNSCLTFPPPLPLSTHFAPTSTTRTLCAYFISNQHHSRLPHSRLSLPLRLVQVLATN